MNEQTRRDFVLFIALGTILEEQGLKEEDLLSSDESRRLCEKFPDSLLEAEEEEALATAKAMFREVVDRILGEQTEVFA